MESIHFSGFLYRYKSYTETVLCQTGFKVQIVTTSVWVFSMVPTQGTKTLTIQITWRD